MTTDVDPRTIVTPYAFTVSNKLLHRPLASPTRRAIALLIDLAVVAMLAELSLTILAGAILLVALFRRLGWRLGPAISTAVFAAIALWLAATIVIDLLPQQPPESAANQHASAVTTNASFADECGIGCAIPLTFDLAQTVLTDSAGTPEQLQQYQLSPPVAAEIATEVANNSGEVQREMKEASLSAQQEIAEAGELVMSPEQAQQLAARSTPWLEQLEQRDQLDASASHGLPWAAFYFTLFIARFRGQTLGKRIMRIQVLRLDNKPISLWEAFGRYGGYGAGLATGTLGFIQIFWDPNRQGIHDKIASTVVVDLRSKARANARQVTKTHLNQD